MYRQCTEASQVEFATICYNTYIAHPCGFQL